MLGQQQPETSLRVRACNLRGVVSVEFPDPRHHRPHRITPSRQALEGIPLPAAGSAP